MNDLWAAIAIALILEGMMPFLSPKSWRQAVLKIATTQDKNIRILGGMVMAFGVLLLTFIR